MKKTIYILIFVLALSLIAACAEQSMANNPTPERKPYKILATGSSFLPNSYKPTSFATFDNDGLIGTVEINNTPVDPSIENLVGSCLYGTIEDEKWTYLEIIECP